MVLSLLVFIIAFGGSSNSEVPRVRTDNLLKNVFTNLTHSFAQAVRFELSSAVSQGMLRSMKLGSAGSKVRNGIGAASSFGIGQLEFLRISIGVSAAKARTSEAVSKVMHSQLGRRWRRSQLNRVKRDDVSAATSLNEVTGPGAKSVMGSTGISAGPVATSISLGSILLAARNSFSAVNAGALAAHAGNTDASNTFSNSNTAGSSAVATRSKGIEDVGDDGNEEEEEIYENTEDDDKDDSETNLEQNDGGDEEDTKENEDSEDEDEK